jgi:hypothetical protein
LTAPTLVESRTPARVPRGPLRLDLEPWIALGLHWGCT